MFTQQPVISVSGSVIMYAGAGVPDGYLLCNGQAVSRTTYANLYAALGGVSSPWGQGDGSTTFNVPDMQEAAPTGVGSSARSEGSHDSYTLGQFKDDQVQTVTHNHTFPIAYSSGAGPYAYTGSGSLQNTGTDSAASGTAGTPRMGTVTRGKRIGLNFIIHV